MLIVEIGELVALFESDKSQDNKKGTVIFRNFVADKGTYITELGAYILNFNDTSFNHVFLGRLGRARISFVMDTTIHHTWGMVDDLSSSPHAAEGLGFEESRAILWELHQNAFESIVF